MKLTFGLSPCPNDTFSFDAVINRRIELDDLLFSPVMKDIEELNSLAVAGQLDVSKISCSNYPLISADYQLLRTGAALGHNCGPLLVATKDYQWSELPDLKIAIPGKMTTANLLLCIFATGAVNKTEMLFSGIEDAVIKGIADVGLIIHESRFTYQQKGLKKLADLGELWQQYTGAPLPLGCIVIRRNLPEQLKLKVERLLQESVNYAFKQPQASSEFVKANASEMSEAVQQQHIDLYVNEFSLDLGEQGKKAMELLFRKGFESGLLPIVKEPAFIT